MTFDQTKKEMISNDQQEVTVCGTYSMMLL